MYLKLAEGSDILLAESVEDRIAGVASADKAQPASCVADAATASIAEPQANSRRESALPSGSAVESAPDWETPISGSAGPASGITESPDFPAEDSRVSRSVGSSLHFRAILAMDSSHRDPET
jgi:hypothetical protein